MNAATLELLAHIFYSCDAVGGDDATQSVRAAINYLVHHGLIVATVADARCFLITEKGEFLVLHFLRTPLPVAVTQWGFPEEEL